MVEIAADEYWEQSFASNVLPDADARGASAYDFRAAFRLHPAGVALITADAGDGPVAMTASSVSSVSLDPPALVFSLSAQTSATPTIRRAQTLVVHLLSTDQLPLAVLGAARGVDRFADRAQWTRLPTGEPYFPSAYAWIRGRIAGTIDIGGSTIVAVEALHVRPPHDAAGDPSPTEPLVYHNRAWHRLSEQSRIPGG